MELATFPLKSVSIARKNHIWDQESGLFSNCELILCYNSLRGKKAEIQTKIKSLVQIILRIGTVADPKQCLEPKRSDGLAEQLGDITLLLRVVGPFAFKNNWENVHFHWVWDLQQKTWCQAQPRQRLRGLPSLSREISRVKAKGGKELFKCKERGGQKRKTIWDFFPRGQPQSKQGGSNCP